MRGPGCGQNRLFCLNEDKKSTREAENLKRKKVEVKLLEEEPVPPGRLNQRTTDQNRSETCLGVLSTASSALAIHEACGHHRSPAGSGVLKGPPMAAGSLFVVAFWEFSFVLCFPFFCCCFIIPFLQGPQIPSWSSVIFVKWRSIHQGYLNVCGPERKHSPKSSKPQGFISTEDCEGYKEL